MSHCMMSRLSFKIKNNFKSFFHFFPLVGIKHMYPMILFVRATCVKLHFSYDSGIQNTAKSKFFKNPQSMFNQNFYSKCGCSFFKKMTETEKTCGYIYTR